MKLCLLLAILLVGIYSQAEQVLYYSNITSTVFETAQEDTSFQTRYKVPKLTPDYSKQAGNLSYSYKSLRPEATWVFTDGRTNFNKTQKIFPAKWYVKYSLCICSYCPTGTAKIIIQGTGFYVLTDAAGNVIGSGHVFQTSAVVQISLKCGCDNNFYLYIYNFFPSPLGVNYYVTQPNQASCYTCKNPSLAFYNTKTCMCECATNCPCKSPLKWFDYPTCACMCEKSLLCNQQYQFFDSHICNCNCRPRCCLPWQIQDPKTCKCVNNAVASLTEESGCVEEVCTPSMSWHQQSCSCI